MDFRGVQELLLGLAVPAPWKQDGKQLIGWYYGAAAVFARNKLEMDEMSAEMVRAILAADPVRWPSLVDLAVGLNRCVWNYNGGVHPWGDDLTTRWWKIADALKNRVAAEWQLRY